MNQIDYSKQILEIMPVSVIDIEAQKKRKNEDHDNVSSRKNFSPFPQEINTLCYEFYLRDSDFVFDPFSGWGERHAEAIKFNKKYIGYDTSVTAINKAREEYGVENLFRNSLTDELPKGYNGVITCPPYWNLEKYEGAGIDRNKKWSGFLEDYFAILNNVYKKAEDGCVFCIMVGDWRKNHKYYDLEYQTCKSFEFFGAEIIDKVVVSRKKVSKIKIMLPQAKRLGYTVKVHENLLVFRKV
jgi:DNA modification methylase